MDLFQFRINIHLQLFYSEDTYRKPHGYILGFQNPARILGYHHNRSSCSAYLIVPNGEMPSPQVVSPIAHILAVRSKGTENRSCKKVSILKQNKNQNNSTAIEAECITFIWTSHILRQPDFSGKFNSLRSLSKHEKLST